MTPAQVTALVEQNAEALLALHRANHAYDTAMYGMKLILEALHEASRQQGNAIAAAVATNEEVLRKLRGS